MRAAIPCIVEVTVTPLFEGAPLAAMQQALQQAVEYQLRKAITFSPDGRFDWSTARVDVVDRT